MAYTAPRTENNLVNMMTCQKAMAQKLHYVFGEDADSWCSITTERGMLPPWPTLRP